MPARDINLATVDGKELPAVGGNNDLPNGRVEYGAVVGAMLCSIVGFLIPMRLIKLIVNQPYRVQSPKIWLVRGLVKFVPAR